MTNENGPAIFILVTKATPSLSDAKGKVTRQQASDWGWTEHLIAVRSCYYCQTLYRNAGYAWRCEHWHHPL